MTKIISLSMLKNFFLTTSAVMAALVILSVPQDSYADIINRQLQLGMSGSDVSLVQTFLAKDVTLYPQGLVTGYFGFLTKSAVANFQTRNGIDPVGRIGPATLPVLNLQIAGGSSDPVGMGGIAPTISGVNVVAGRNTATINWNTNQNSKGVVYFSTARLTTYEREHSVDVGGIVAMTDSNFRTTQNVAVPNLQANTTYYYMIYTTNSQGDVSVTVPTTFQTTN